jgi:hypothetical protein
VIVLFYGQGDGEFCRRTYWRYQGMKQLTDFKPLQRVVLPGLGDLNCSGLVVVVGPNSSGKSQLLQDIHRRLIGEPRKLVVSTEIAIEKPPFEPFMKCLEEAGYFSTLTDDAGNQQLHMHPADGIWGPSSGRRRLLVERSLECASKKALAGASSVVAPPMGER